jgi:O-methyltransferase involved in polyketide biosynthesis
VVFTYIHRGVIDGSVRFEGGDKLVRSVQKLHEPWKFGLIPAELEGYLARFGLRLEENLGADEYRTRYFEPRRVVDRGYAFYRIAVADVAPPRGREA